MFFFEFRFNGIFGIFKLFVSFFEASFGENSEIIITFLVKTAEGDVFYLGADSPHLEAVGKRGEDF